MRTFLLAVAATLALAGPAAAQRATEQYIPIGQSPGAITMQGQVSAAVEPAAAGGETQLSMRTAADTPVLDYAIGPGTRIYIDRSAQGQASTMGSLADLQPGRGIEVAVGGAQTRTALWIKVRAD